MINNKRLTVFLCLGTLLLTSLAIAEIERPDDAPPALEPAESAQQIRVPEGFRVELVASEPLIHDPTGVCWDERGRLFVCELHGYNLEGQYDIEELNKTGELDRVVRRIQANDEAKKKAMARTYGTVKLLHDTNGDGRMDRADVWADDLPPCYGICPAREGVIVACAPDIIYLSDSNGDGKADVREVLFTGFPVGALERGISAPQWGVDGWIYFGAGHGGGEITGPRLHEPVRLPNTDFRIKADGSQIEPVSGRTGTFGFTFTESYERLVVNTQSPLFVAPLPWTYLARNPDAAMPGLQHRLLPYQRVYPRSRPHPWRTRRAEDPGFSEFYTNRYGIEESSPNGYFTSACSPLVYHDSALPGLQGQLFVCEPAQNMVHRAVLEPDGPQYRAHRAAGEEESEFLASSDTWFNPMSLSHGPDGAIWIVDFYREIIEDYSAIPRYLQQLYGLMNGQERGRIYRLVHEEMLDAPPARMDHFADSELAQEVASTFLWRRQTASRLLVERSATVAAEQLSQIVEATSAPAAVISALHTLELLDSLQVEELKTALAHPAASVRVHALRLSDRRFAEASTLLEAVLQMVDDPEPTVQLQLALSLGESEDSRVIGALASLARERGEVRWLHDAVLSSLARRGGEMLEHLLAAPDNVGSAEALLDPLCAAIAARSDAEEVSQTLVLISTAHHPPAQTACLTGLLRHARNLRKFSLLETGQSALDDLVASNVEEVSAEASSLAKGLRTESLLDRVARLERAAGHLADLQLPVENRLAIIAELAEDEGPEIAHTLLRAFADGTPAVREAILAALFGRRDRLPDVVRAMEKGNLSPAALDAIQRATLLEHSDPQLRERAIQLLSATSPAIEEHLPRYLAALEGPRDPRRGEFVFRQHCANCHQAHGIGHAVGPDLTAESQRSEETLVRDVLAPSDSITAGYTTYLVVTTSGQVYTGLIASETANNLVLLEAEGKRTTILRKDIEELQASPVSMMPEKLYTLISPEELADALAWLRSPPAQRTGASNR